MIYFQTPQGGMKIMLTPFPVSHRGEKLSPLLLLPDLLPLWGKAGKGVNITEGMEINFKLF